MADAAAFFAKKTKKKPFSFNANRVDASQITSTIVHVDAPAISDSISMGSLSLNKDTTDRSDGQWDEAVGVSAPSNKQIASKSAGNISEISDMKSMVNKREESKFGDDEIARGNEPNPQTSRAKVDKQENSAWSIKSSVTVTPPPPVETPASTAAPLVSSTTGKWVPSRLRSEESNAPPGQGSSTQMKKNDTLDDLFPDLATADKIMAQVEEQKLKTRVHAPPPPKAAPKVSKTESSSVPLHENSTKSSDETHSSPFLLPPEDPSPIVTSTESGTDHAISLTTDNDVASNIVHETLTVEDKTNTDTESGPERSQDATDGEGENKSAIKKKKKKDLSTFKVSS